MLACGVASCAPVIPNGEIGCDAEHDCPPGYDCIDARCWRTVPDAGGDPDAGTSDAGSNDAGASCAACAPDVGCTVGTCVHPCSEDLGRCPPGTECHEALGCLRATCPCSVPGRICATPDDVCFDPCDADTPCGEGASCSPRGFCESTLDRCTRLLALRSLLAGSDACTVERNDDFADGTLDGWCCGWRAGSSSLPEPTVLLGAETMTLRPVVDLMGRDPAYSVSGPYAFSFMKVLPVFDVTQLERVVAVELGEVVLGGELGPFGVLLEIAVGSESGERFLVQRWGSSSAGEEERAFGRESGVTLPPLGLLELSPPPFTRTLPEILAQVGLDEHDVTEVRFALTVWTSGPRIILPIERFSIAPM